MSHIIFPDSIAFNLPDDMPDISVPPEPVFPPEPIVPPEPIAEFYGEDRLGGDPVLGEVPAAAFIDMVFDFG